MTTLPEGISSLYVMDGDIVRRARTMEEWNEGYSLDKRRIGFLTVDGVDISTVFLAFPSGAWMGGEPDFFETMVFGGPFDEECWRYKTLAEALVGHVRIAAAVTAGENLREVEL